MADDAVVSSGQPLGEHPPSASRECSRYGRPPNYGCIWRAQLNGPKEVALLPLVPGSMLSFNHSSGKVLPWTTIRWKFATS